MMISTRSIQGKILLWIFLSVTSLFLILGYCLHHKFHDVVFDSVDSTLHSKLQLVKGLIHGHGAEIEFEVDEIVQGEYVIPRSGHYYQIFVNGEISIASESLVEETFEYNSQLLESYDDDAKEWIYLSVGPADEPVRLIRHEFEFLDKSITIVVAERLTESLAMIDGITNYFLFFMPIMIILVGLVGFIIASRSLQPLITFSASIADITHKTLEKRLEKGHLALELQGLAEAFNSLLTRLQVGFESEKNFIADAAHELKTPLAVIMAQCDISLQKRRPALEYIETLHEIKSVSNSMLRQINGMLTLARLDSGILTSSPFQQISLSQCIHNATRLVEPVAEKYSITIKNHTPEELMVTGDMDTLTEALVNIIENGVRYNMTNGVVEIHGERLNNLLVIHIKDSGIGISKAESTRIFDRFYRSEHTRGMEGTGLGLSIARAVLHAHHGNITVKSSAGNGSCFTISLPSPPPSSI